MQRGAIIHILLIIFAILAMFMLIIPLMIVGAFRNGDIAKSSGSSFGVCGNIPEPYGSLFEKAGNKFGVQPAFLGAIFVGEHPSIKETNYETWPNAAGPWATSPAGANGPFQFLLSTWEGHKQDGDGDGVMNIQDLDDAAFGAAHMLSGNGAGTMTTDEARLRDSASRYNSGREWARGQNIAETKRYVDELVIPSFQAFYCDPRAATIANTSTNKQGNDGVPLYKQGDYKNVEYAPGKSIAESGCCPVSAAMVMRYYGLNVDPISISQLSFQNGYYVYGEGTNHAGLFPFLAKKYNLQFANLGRDWNKALSHLDNKQPLIVRGQGSVPFTPGGHCIVITGYDKSTGLVRVNNPATGDGPYPLNKLKSQVTVIYFLGK